MMDVDAAGLIRRALDFEPARGEVGRGRRGPGFRRSETTFGQAQRIPAESETAADRQQGDDREHHGHAPAQWRQRAQECRGRHGNAFRSSSK